MVKLLHNMSMKRLAWVDGNEIAAVELQLTSYFVLYAIKRKNLLWTRSTDLTRPIWEGFQRTEQNSKVGLTRVVYNVLRHSSFLIFIVLRIRKPRHLSAFEHIYSTWEENNKFGWNTVPKFWHLLISICWSVTI